MKGVEDNMKKLLIIGAAGLIAFSVSCSKETTKRITYLDKAGQIVEFDLRASSDEEMVNKAVEYVNSVDYSDVEVVGLDAQLGYDFKIELEKHNSLSYSGNEAIGCKISDDGFSIKLNTTQESVEQYPVNDGNSTDIKDESYKNVTSSKINMYYEYGDDDYLYYDNVIDIANYVNDKEASSLSQSSRNKVDLSEFVEEDIDEEVGFTGVSSASSILKPYIDNYLGQFTSTDIQKIEELINQMKANSKIIVSSVTNDTFTIQVQVSMNEIFTTILSQLLVKPIDLEGIDNKTIYFDFKFQASTGRLVKSSMNADLKSYINSLLEATVDINDTNSKLTYMPVIDAAKLNYSLEIEYDSISIDRLSDSQKNLYKFTNSIM